MLSLSYSPSALATLACYQYPPLDDHVALEPCTWYPQLPAGPASPWRNRVPQGWLPLTLRSWCLAGTWLLREKHAGEKSGQAERNQLAGSESLAPMDCVDSHGLFLSPSPVGVSWALQTLFLCSYFSILGLPGLAILLLASGLPLPPALGHCPGPQPTDLRLLLWV
jgi:hypothetical protein